MRKIKTGLYGGSFNPIHNGHMAIAEHMLDNGYVDEVWFMVSPQNPLKKQTDLLDDSKRFEMVGKALENCGRRMMASDYEFRLSRPSYTWHTLQALSKDFPDREFTLLIGADNWCRFRQWFHADDILQHHNIIIYPRKNSNIDKNALPQGVTLADTCLYDISSTDIRNTLRKGGDIRNMVPANIAELAVRYYGMTIQTAL